MMENNKNANEDCSSFTKGKLVKFGVIKIIGFGTSCFMKINKTKYFRLRLTDEIS